MAAIATNLCNNILNRGKKEKIPITQMKLQRILYYICRDYVVKTEEYPLYEKFQVWKYGPVLPSVYGTFESFKSKPITLYAKDVDGFARKVNESKNPILATAIDIVWAKCKRLTGIQLSKITHEKGSGWYAAFQRDDEIITVEDMLNDSTLR